MGQHRLVDDPEFTRARSEWARGAQAGRSKDPDVAAAGRIMREKSAERRIKEIVDGAPPLSPETRERLAAILAPHATRRDGAA